MTLRAIGWAGAIAAALLLVAGPGGAAEDPVSFETWLGDVRAEGLKRGINEATLGKALSGLKPVERIIRRDRNQPEFKQGFGEYLTIRVSDKAVVWGREAFATNRALLNEVGRKYGVQPRIIVSIWGMESRYGRHLGNEPVIASVATLAYDVRRSRFYREQLFSALLMVDKGYIELENMKGSWAGAMGQSQFIPSSYLRFAVDYDGDGRRDIWRSKADVFASIANYLARHGWRSDEKWGRAVTLPEGFGATLKRLLVKSDRGCPRGVRCLTAKKPLTQWQSLGVRRAGGADLPKADIAGALVLPDGPGGRAFLVYDNYRAVLGYNYAHHYALAVGMLADRLRGS